MYYDQNTFQISSFGGSKMKTLALAILISGTGLVPGSMAQNASPTVFSEAGKELAKEWQTKEGFTACLNALEEYSKPGSLDPKKDAADALTLLSNGLRTAATIYDSAAKADLPTFRNELAKATTVTVAKSDKANNDLVVALAGKIIGAALAQHPVELNTEVAKKYQNNSLWALSQLMKLSCSTDCADKVSADLRTAADQALSAAKRADSAAGAKVAAARNTLTSAQSKLTDVQTDLTSASKDLSTVSTDLAPPKGAVNISDAQTKAQTAQASVTKALSQIKSINDAKNALASAIQAKTAADQSLTTTNTLVALVLPKDATALALNAMELYRICYGLGSDTLFKPVADYFKKPAK